MANLYNFQSYGMYVTDSHRRTGASSDIGLWAQMRDNDYDGHLDNV
jgi:hypothetical protein